MQEVDWVVVEAEYRTGIKPLRHIASAQGITEAAIRKRAKRDDWVRDLSGKIKAKTEELVRKAEVRKTVRNEAKTNEATVIEIAARNQADLILSHRTAIPRYQKLAEALLAELELQTANKEDFATLGELMRAPNEKGIDKLNEIYKKVMDTPGRVDSFKKLSETYKTLVGLERQAFGLADNANGEANAPEEKVLAPNDAARRIAFLFNQALLNQAPKE